MGSFSFEQKERNDRKERKRYDNRTFASSGSSIQSPVGPEKDHTRHEHCDPALAKCRAARTARARPNRSCLERLADHEAKFGW